MIPDTLIDVDVSKLETREQRAAVCKSFEEKGWSFDAVEISHIDQFTGERFVKTYRFCWERLDSPVYPEIPPICIITKIH